MHEAEIPLQLGDRYACMEAGRWPQCLSLLESMRSEEALRLQKGLSKALSHCGQVQPDSIALACAAQACRDGRPAPTAGSTASSSVL